MLSITVQTKNARKRMQDIRKRLNNLPWLAAGEIVRQSIHQNFIMGGRPKKWAKRKVEQSWPVLRKSDTLMNAHYVEPIINGVAIGNRLAYQAVHNFGYPPKNIAKREYLMTQQKDIKAIMKIFKKHIGIINIKGP